MLLIILFLFLELFEILVVMINIIYYTCKQYSFVNKLFKKTTALHISCDKNNLSMVQLLLKNGADPSHVETRRRQCTTLHLAAMKGNLKMMQLLINNGFDLEELVNAEAVIQSKGDSDCMSAFLILCRNGNIECLDYLLSVCAFVDKAHGMHVSMAFKQRSMLKYLITEIYSNNEIVSELMQIIKEGAIDDCKILLQAAMQAQLVMLNIVFLFCVLSCHWQSDQK